MENVLIKVEQLYIPCDFIVLDMEEDVNILLILGRPFLATVGAQIDVKERRLTFNVEGETTKFLMVKRFPNSPSSPTNQCFKVDISRNETKNSFKPEPKQNLFEEYLKKEREKELQIQIKAMQMRLEEQMRVERAKIKKIRNKWTKIRKWVPVNKAKKVRKCKKSGISAQSTVKQRYLELQNSESDKTGAHGKKTLRRTIFPNWSSS